MKGLVQTAIASELRHPQRKLRVRDDLRSVVLEAGRSETLAKWISIAEAVASMKLCERDAFWRVFRVQVEREPRDVGVELAP